MTHTYILSGLTCTNCEAKVQEALAKVTGVKKVSINLASNEAVIDMERHVPTGDLKAALKKYPKYSIEEKEELHTMSMDTEEEPKTWWQTYKPIILVLSYLLGATLLVEISVGGFDPMRWMRHFMAGFFLTFSFFKLLDLKGFAENYVSYDIVARKWFGWGYVYAFIELLLGIAFLVDFNPLLTNWVTLLVMGVSILGVLKSVLNKRKIKCACLGAVFNLPMSTVTIVEDAAMIGMSAAMIITLNSY